MPNHILLQEIEVSAAVASVTFANIPQTGYTDLKVVINARSTTSNTGYGRLSLLMALNGSSSTFTGRDMLGFGSDGTGATNYSTGRCGWIVANDATSNTFSLNEINLLNYTSSANKVFSADFTTENNTTGKMVQGMAAGLWSTVNSISSITFTVESNYSFSQYSTFSLYGVASVGTTPTVAPKASGGNTITTDGTYWYHAFLTSGTFIPLTSLTADVLTIAGGGGGQASGDRFGGGGGAGGLLYSSAQSLTSGSYTVSIGAGGAASATLASCKGSSTDFTGLTSPTGGGGGSMNAAGASGGSGGGGGLNNAGGAASPSGQGNAGGNGTTSSNRTAGGGGGAGGAGGNNSNNYGGAGGVGLNTYSSWASATSTGVSGYYAGGGGGSAYTYNDGVIDGGPGGSGGGGMGANYQGGGGNATHNAVAGTANTGGGGGGGAWIGQGADAAPGGSGIVIVRYAV